MTFAFIPARDLKPRYRVSGHFYALHVPGLEPLQCRSVLEITAAAATGMPVADAVFVMMNPGSSRPITEAHQAIQADGISRMSVQLVPAKPDTTQYQIMRVMHYAGWQRVRVINLSDLRDPASGSFYQRYLQVERDSGSRVHSIFSPQRSAELKRHLARKPGGAIVRAWGVSGDLDPLIDRATPMFGSDPTVTGLAKPGQAGKFFHPLPTLQREKEHWVQRMMVQLAV